MTKSELIKAVAKQASLTEAQTNEAVKALTDVITAALAKGEKVQLPGLFTAEAVASPARHGRTPPPGAAAPRATRRRPRGRAPGNLPHIHLPHHSDAYLRRRRDSSCMRGRIGLRATMGMGRVVDLVGIGDHSGHRRLCDDLPTAEVMASLRS